jgi:hypothetical protein
MECARNICRCFRFSAKNSFNSVDVMIDPNCSWGGGGEVSVEHFILRIVLMAVTVICFRSFSCILWMPNFKTVQVQYHFSIDLCDLLKHIEIHKTFVPKQ